MIGDLTGVTSQVVTCQGTISGGVVEINAIEIREITNVPEPSTYAMVMGGLLILCLIGRRLTVRL